MANAVKELERKLKSAGAIMIKHGTKHDFWALGEETIILPHGSKLDWRWERNTEKVIRRYQQGGKP